MKILLGATWAFPKLNVVVWVTEKEGVKLL